MDEISNDRSRRTSWIVFGLLLTALLYLLIVHFSRVTGIQRRTVMTVVRLLPPPLPVQPAPTPRPPIRRVPAKTAGVTRMMSTPVPTAKPLPPRPAPKTPVPAVTSPLTVDTPVDENPYDLSQGANQGFAIGGGGDGGNGGGGGDGGGCSAANAKLYPSMINAQLRTVFTRHEAVDSRTFKVKAQLWFDAGGHVQRAQLVGSTGDSGLDSDVVHLLAEVNIGAPIPSCFQPATVWVRQPWNGPIDDTDEQQPDPKDAGQRDVLIWHTAPRR